MSTDADAAILSQRFTPEEQAFFESNGYIIVRGLAGPDVVTALSQATVDGLLRQTPPVEYEADLQYPGAPASRAVAGGDTIRRLKEAHGRHPLFTGWVAQPRVSGKLRQLLGGPVVMPLAHHNCIMTKQPVFSSETHWHQDIRYWSYQRPELISLWLALGHETQQNGCLELVPGSHRETFAPERFDKALFFREDLPENAARLSQKIQAELSPGDALFFHCRTLHAAGSNQTRQTKYSVVYTFRAADNLPRPGSRSAAMPELLLPE